MTHKRRTKKSHKNGNIIPKKKSKGLIWLETNLFYWAKERALNLVREHIFDKERKWRFDFCFPAVKIAVEYEGGIFMEKSGHNNMKGMQRDVDKYTRAQLLGWTVIRVTARNYTTVLKTLNAFIKTK